MTHHVWLLCVALIFGFILLRSDSSEGRALDFSPIEYQRKRRAEGEFMAKGLNAVSEDGPPFIPPIEFGRKKEVTRGFMGKVVNQPPYIPPIEFGRKRDGSNTLKEKQGGLRSTE